MMNAKQESAVAIETRLEYLRRLLETKSEKSNLLAGLLTEASLVNDANRLEPLRDLIEFCATKNFQKPERNQRSYPATEVEQPLQATWRDWSR